MNFRYKGSPFTPLRVRWELRGTPCANTCEEPPWPHRDPKEGRCSIHTKSKSEPGLQKITYGTVKSCFLVCKHKGIKGAFQPSKPMFIPCVPEKSVVIPSSALRPNPANRSNMTRVNSITRKRESKRNCTVLLLYWDIRACALSPL